MKSSQELFAAAQELLQQDMPSTTKVVFGQLLEYATVLEKAYENAVAAERIADETMKAMWRARERRGHNPGQPGNDKMP